MTRRSTPEIRARAAALREDHGWTVEKIATELGFSASAVSWWFLIDAVDKPGAHARGPGPQSDCVRDGVPVRRFTAEEDRVLTALDATGLRHCEVVRRLNATFPDRPRKPNTVRNRLATLARREERALAREVARSAPFRSGHEARP